MTFIFVYNANSGKLNALLDTGHKLLNPSTYPCSLCALTYDTFSENNLWKTFRIESKAEMIFYHKDEFEAEFPDADISYPSVLKLEDLHLSTLLNKDDLNEIPSVELLIEKLKTILP
ncbi:GTPase [Winogradskyella tangerina]|uniref:GTPase n=1 Tax=Winogradskyella tangerina TaxID=2023240 RepID=UPI000DBEA65D|nr:GTPase [Winogradskyella tangerina]